MKEILEHKILEVLIGSASYQITRVGSDAAGHIPIYKKNYWETSLHFGTLVDILNSPEKYAPDKAPKGSLNPWKNISRKEEEIMINDYSFAEVADAIEVLAANNHIEDLAPSSMLSGLNERVIKLKIEGIVAFRKQFYLREVERELSIFRGYEIQKTDILLKKYWYLVEIAKYILGGTVGALIASYKGCN